MATCRKCGTPNLTAVQYFAHHCYICHMCNDPVGDDVRSAHDRMHELEKPPPQSTAVIALPGDRIVFCFSNENHTQDDAGSFIDKLGANLPGVKIGVVFGISGVVVYRGGESNDTDRRIDDSG
jgi:hypothetical protein